MARKWSDNAKAALATSLTAVSTTLTLATGKGALFPAVTGAGTAGFAPDFFVVVISDGAGNFEKIKVEHRAGDVLGSGGYPLIRGYDGTTAQSWTASSSTLVRLAVDDSFAQDVSDRLLALANCVMYGTKPSTTSGLNWGYYGGLLNVDGVLTAVADGIAVLGASATNYVERDDAGTVSVNTTGFSANKHPIAQITTSGTAITAITDRRFTNEPFMGVVSKSVAGGVDVTLTTAEVRAPIIDLTGVITANINVVLPAVKRDWIVRNSTTGAFSVTVKTASGSGVTIPQGSTASVFCDGTNIASSSLEVTTTKGDLIVRSASAQARLPVGADNQVLTADAAQPLGVKWASVAQPVFEQYELIYVSATSVRLMPRGGNLLTINGVAAVIPDAGVTYTISGLAANTLYYLYATQSGGTVNALVPLVAGSNPHSVSATTGNKGVEILTGDDTRTLVGMVRTNGSTQFVDSPSQRFVRSFRNRRGSQRSLTNVLGITISSASGAWGEPSTAPRLEFLSWADENVAMNANGVIYNNSTACRTFFGIGIDSATSPSVVTSYYQQFTAGGETPIAVPHTAVLAEGYHYLSALMVVSGGTGAWGGTGGGAGQSLVANIN